jgi:hypothetical protein
MEGYIYLGEHFDVQGRSVGITDKKIGLSKNPIGREYQLSRTKSPIKYRILSVYKVDNMNRVEKMLHNILDSRRVEGEWFKDDEDTLTGEFIGFMDAYGSERCSMEELKPVVEPTLKDQRLMLIYNQFADKEKGYIELVRSYKGVDYDVILDSRGLLNFKGEVFDTPNKLYNNGIVKYATGKKGGSGTNHMAQFTVKESGERLSEPVISE